MKKQLDLEDAVLRGMTTQDLPALRDLLHDVQVRRFLCDDEILPDAWFRETLERSDGLDPNGLGLWAIEAPDGSFLGMAGLRPLGESATTHADLVGAVQLTIAVGPPAWGKGLARRASERLLTHGFEDLGLPRVIAIVDDPNERSHALIQRLGFTRIGSDTGPAYSQIVYARGAG